MNDMPGNIPKRQKTSSSEETADDSPTSSNEETADNIPTFSNEETADYSPWVPHESGQDHLVYESFKNLFPHIYSSKK